MERRIAVGLDIMGMYFRDLSHIVMPKYIRRTPPLDKVRRFLEVMHDLETEIAETDNHIWEVTCRYENESRTTKIFLHGRYDPEKPSVVFHHGAGTIDYEKQRGIVIGKNFEGYNTFSIKAQHHSSRRDFFENCVDSFLHLQLTIGGSVLALEWIIRYHQERSSEPIVATGISMGGVIASLHFLLFDSADMYFPIVAYPNVGEMLLGRAYRFGLDRRDQRIMNRSFTESFDFQDNKLNDSNRQRIFPILASYDWYVDLQKATKFWEGYTVEKVGTGHNSLGAVKHLIQEYISRRINKMVNAHE